MVVVVVVVVVVLGEFSIYELPEIFGTVVRR